MQGAEPLSLSFSYKISSMGGDGCAGKLSVDVSCGDLQAMQTELIPNLLVAKEISCAASREARRESPEPR